MKKKRRLKKWVKITIAVMLIGGFGLCINKINNKNEYKSNIIKEELVFYQESKTENTVEKESKNVVISNENEQKVEENIQKDADFEQKIEQNKKTFRLTSFYPSESGNCTGSGKCSWDFQTNDKGWYTWNGKLFLAAATTYLQKSFGYVEGKKYFKYYDEVNVTIDGNTYRGVILDSCGACMKVTYEERLDLFVNSSQNTIDRGYKGNNSIYVEW